LSGVKKERHKSGKDIQPNICANLNVVTTEIWGEKVNMNPPEVHNFSLIESKKYKPKNIKV
jgi:hypothetical protein